MPLGVDIVEPPMLVALRGRGHHRPRRPADHARRPRDEVARRDHAAQHRPRPGRRRRTRSSPRCSSPASARDEVVALATKMLYDLGSRRRRGHQRHLRRALLTASRTSSLTGSSGPGDQAYFDIIQAFVGYRTCYYRTFAWARATDAQTRRLQAGARVDGRVDRAGPAGRDDRQGRAAVWPKATEFGFETEMECFGLQFGHGVGLFLHERPIISRLNSLTTRSRSRRGWSSRSRRTARPRTASRRRGSRRRSWSPTAAAGHHALPVGGAVRRQRLLT